MPLPRAIHYIQFHEPACAICRKPVKLEVAKTDEGGKAVHEECYAKKIAMKLVQKLRKPAQSEAKQSRQTQGRCE